MLCSEPLRHFPLAGKWLRYRVSVVWFLVFSVGDKSLSPSWNARQFLAAWPGHQVMVCPRAMTMVQLVCMHFLQQFERDAPGLQLNASHSRWGADRFGYVFRHRTPDSPCDSGPSRLVCVLRRLVSVRIVRPQRHASTSPNVTASFSYAMMKNR